MKKKHTAKHPKKHIYTHVNKLPESVFLGFFRICLIAYIDCYQIITALKAGPNRLIFFEETNGHLGVI